MRLLVLAALFLGFVGGALYMAWDIVRLFLLS